MIESEFGFASQGPSHIIMSENGSHDTSSHQASEKEVSSSPLSNPEIPGILRANGASEEAIARVYNHKGEIIYTTEDDIDFRDPNLQLFTAEAELYKRTAPIYDLVDYRLRGDKPPQGYSHHNLDQHVVPVAKYVKDIMDMGRYPHRIRMLGLMAAYGHDVGNINRRSGHSHDSPDVYAAAVPSVQRYDKDWDIVRRAMELHDEKAIMKEIHSWGPLNSEDRILRILEMGESEGLSELPAVLASLILADKADIDRARINPWAINHEAVADDEHVWVNLCADNEGFRLSPNGKELVLRINFNQYVKPEEYNKFAPVMRKRSHHDGFRIHVPEKIHDAYQVSKDEYFLQWTRSLERIYNDRITLMMYMAFVALPVDRFSLEMIDPEDGSILVRPFDPGKMDKQMAARALKFEDEEKRKEEYLSFI